MPRTTEIRPSASRMRSASRSDGRDTPKRSTSSGSRPSESPSESWPDDDQPAQLVGDLLGLLHGAPTFSSTSADRFFLARGNAAS